MPVEHRVFTDVANHVYHDHIEISGANLPLAGSTNWAVRQRRMKGGLSDGVDVVELDNGALKLEILPTRGMGLWRGSFQGIPIGWDSPVKLPVNPAFVNQTERGGLGWLSGFNELLCRCGLSFMGPPGRDTDFHDHPILGELTLHGKIANLPAHKVEVTADPESGKLAVIGIVEESSMFGPSLRLTSAVTTTVGSNSITIIDEITNLSAKPAEFQLLYHTNIGRPFLETNSRFLAPIREMCPRDTRAAEGIESFDSYAAPDVSYAEQAYLFRLIGNAKQKTVAMLQNAARDRGISLRFSVVDFPCFTLWKNTAAEADGYVTGLEPGTNFPNLRSFERAQGRVTTLAPGASRRMSLEMAIHANKDSVKAITDEISHLQNSVTLTFNRSPQSRYSP